MLLLSPTRLSQLLKSEAAQTIVLDSTWFMPNSTRIAAAEFRTKRIPGARFLDLDEVASPHELGLKHMLPSGEIFARACEKFGIGRSSRVVVYDSHGVFSSPRALWMFKSFGHEDAAILDGGLPRWEAEGFPVDQEPPLDDVKSSNYPPPTADDNAVRSYGQMVYNSGLVPFETADAELVFDARSRGRYLGTDPEPRPGLSSGHIPNSFSLPFNTFLQTNAAPNGTSYTTYLPESQLRSAIVEALGPQRAESLFKGDVSVITTCGSGMSAAVLWLGLQLLGIKQVSLYDESWTGYAQRPSSRIDKSQ
ncbi:Rhodanese-like domain-containing protein [Favolaschia claudopus]|uniref:Rhodanese-like domain-containing protein n=1 Tax=Favolaschia claudopus TaxID=2862362 RepID=A0AAW0EIN2_9AGAR